MQAELIFFSSPNKLGQEGDLFVGGIIVDELCMLYIVRVFVCLWLVACALFLCLIYVLCFVCCVLCVVF